MLLPEFSSITSRRVYRRIACGLLGISLLLPVGAMAASPDADLEKLRKALAESELRQENFSSQLDSLSGEIKALKQKLVTAARNLTLLDQDLADVEERLDHIQEVEDETLSDLSKRNADLAVTLSALINLSRQPEGTLMGNPSGLVDSLRASSLLQSILPKLKKEADQLSDQLDTLASLRSQYAAEREEFNALRDKRIAEQDTLDQLLGEKRAAQEKIAAANKKEQLRLQKLTADVRDTEALLQRLEEDKARQKAEEQARLQREIEEKERLARAAKEAEATKQLENEVAHNRSVISPKIVSPGTARHFTQAKGLLPMPVGGRIVTKYNESDQAGHKKGIVIETRPEAAVISPFDGQIAFAGPFRHYGLLLIIDHGDGYHTLLAGMGYIDGTVGQLLLAGEPVGQMKKSSKERPKLYMELRNNGAPIDPVPWLMAENRKVSG